jgi:hypothetical protein
VATKVVPGFKPSTHGFHFANRWPATPAWWWGVGVVHLGFGNAGNGLCGGMAFAARDRFERGEPPPSDATPPPAGTPLFHEIVRRQVDSFDRAVVVPWRFWQASNAGEGRRLRETVRVAWPAIRREIDAGRLAMVGLVREPRWNPLRMGMGHQVLAYGYETGPDAVTLRIYDPNHPDDDDVVVRLERGTRGEIRLSQSTGEPLRGLLELPFIPAGRGTLSRFV